MFANGWGSEYLQEVGHGIRQKAALADVDVFAFVNYSVHSDTEENNKGEFSIFTLPDLDDFDGAIVLGSSFNTQTERDYIQKEILRTGIPAISLEYNFDGMDYFGTDDYSGMKQLTEHLIKDHAVNNIVFIGGMKEHAGSNIRLKAVLDAAAENQIVIPDENILYGNFSAVPAVDCMKEWCATHERMPDAIICANDIMAIGICDLVKEQGYNIPIDVIVTGFDCLRVGQEYEPSLTSVNREWLTMGSRCMDKLLQKIAGEEVEPFEEINTSLVCGGSCGCIEEETNQNIRKKSKDKRVDGFFCDQHFRHMNLCVRKSQTAEQLNNSLSDFFIKEGWLEGKRVMVSLHPDFFYTDDWDSMKTKEYPDEVDVICSVFDGEISPIKHMKTKDAMFSIAEKSVMAGTYIYVPVRVDDAVLGFAMISRGFSIVQNDILYIWTRHFNQYIEQVKSNIMIAQLTKRLEALSVTDGLTGVYNRTGCETVIYPKLERCQQQGGQSVLMIADVDRLKRINDTYGHGNGDLAIKVSIEALRQALPEDFMIGRYGGDEFLIGGCMKDEMDVDALIEQIAVSLKKEAADKEVPFKLTMSVGGLQLSKGTRFDIDDCIQKADAKMYKIKAEHHENTEE